MKSTAFRLTEVFFARVLPGVLQFVSIVVLGKLLSAEDYGAFSTGLATAAFLANLLTGPVSYAIVPRRAEYELHGEAAAFERYALWLLLLASSVIVSLAVLAFWVGVIESWWAALAVSSALYAGWLPVLRARLQFWRYGAAALTNASLLLALILFFVTVQPSVSAAIWAFVLSNSAGFLVGWVLCGAPLPRLPGRDVLRSILGVGSSFTVSNAAENGIYLGTRYTIFWFGSAEFLGLFSFAVDLAQRSVGVVINIASFAVVPLSYKIAAGRDSKAFYALLKRGMLISGVASLATFSAVVGLEFSGVLEWGIGEKFSLLAFSAVSVAIVVNRLKKMVLDPVAVYSGAYLSIPVAYALVVPFATGLSIFAAYAGSEYAILAIYPVAYLLVVIFTAMAMQCHGRMSPAE